MRNRQWIVAGAIVVATVGIGVTISSRVDAQTRVDPATGALIGATRPAVLTAPPPRTTATPRGKVDWQGAVGGLRRSGGASEALATNLNKAQVDATRVPILLPNDPSLTAGARIYSFGDYYTITADAPGAGVSLSGTTAIINLPAAKPLRIDPVGPEGLTVQRTVDGQLASFVRYGVLYTVEIRCDRAGDARCADDNYVLGLVGKTTTVVLGAAARAEAGLGG
ncbi:MAG: hypothetical protein KKC14_04895 [Alphaproteobacteria bacterium]|nr:hypothetical protein [Alphaproteobacteria bacterium]